LLTYRDGATHNIYNSGRIHIRFSYDYGDTWTDPNKYLDSSDVGNFPLGIDDDPDPQYDPGETLMMVYSNNKINMFTHAILSGGDPFNLGTHQSYSLDNGKNWSNNNGIIFQGNPYNSLNSGNGHQWASATEDYFEYNGVIYSATRQRLSLAAGDFIQLFVKSTDYGSTWQYVSDISDTDNKTNENGLEYVGNNTIVSLLRKSDNTTTYLAKSTDMGLNWSLSDITSASGLTSRHRIYTRSHLKQTANWWDDPVLIANCFEHEVSGQSSSRKNSILMSLDKGETWPYLFGLDSFHSDGGYGDMFYNPVKDEYVFVSYRGPALDNADIVQYNFKIVWS